jgi:hypothetical protein
VVWRDHWVGAVQSLDVSPWASAGCCMNVGTLGANKSAHSPSWASAFPFLHLPLTKAIMELAGRGDKSQGPALVTQSRAKKGRCGVEKQAIGPWHSGGLWCWEVLTDLASDNSVASGFCFILAESLLCTSVSPSAKGQV